MTDLDYNQNTLRAWYHHLLQEDLERAGDDESRQKDAYSVFATRIALSKPA